MWAVWVFGGRVGVGSWEWWGQVVGAVSREPRFRAKHFVDGGRDVGGEATFWAP